MWQRTRITERLGLTWPIFSASMTPFATPSLAAGVSEAGGVGGLGLTGFPPDECRRRIAGFRQLTDGCLNANILLWSPPGDVQGKHEGMRSRLEEYYRAEDLGPLPDPLTVGNDVSEDLLAVLLETKPEVVSFH